MARVKKDKVIEFLIKYKSFAQKSWVLIPRKKNMDSLAELGVTIKQAKKMILGQSVIDYCSGPEEDLAQAGFHVWVFSTKIDEEQMLYIKLSDDFRGDQAKCISFHKADFQLKQPYRKVDKK